MKKTIAIFSIFSMLFLSGCSLLGEVNNSLNYVNTVTDYLNTAQNFSNEVPQLAQEAVTNTDARVNLEKELIAMKDEIEDFNNIQPPSIAKDIHDKIVSSNEKLQDGIDLYITNVNNGKWDPAVLENSEIMKTINEITNLKNQIENLGL